MSIQFSRGCPFNCDFCNVTALFGHRPRIKTADQIIAELDNLYHRGWRGQVFFVDDNFIGNKKYLMNLLLPALINWQKDKKGFLFNTEASINLADNEHLMHTMVEAGFDTVFIGMVGLLQAPPGTKLYERLKKEGRLSGLLSGDNVDGTTNIIPKMDMRQFLEIYDYFDMR